MNQDLLKEITKDQIKTDTVKFKVGDGVKVHTKVREGDKERIQIFAGIVIARKGSGIHETFTVRRISYGEGVERVFPVNSPNIAKIEVDRDLGIVKGALPLTAIASLCRLPPSELSFYITCTDGRLPLVISFIDTGGTVLQKNLQYIGGFFHKHKNPFE